MLSRPVIPCRRWPILLLALATLLGACSDSDDGDDRKTSMPPGTQVQISIDPSESAGTLDQRYLGFAFDTAQFTGGYWWSSSSGELVPEPTPDLESPKLRKLVSFLAPSRMRIGGTDADAAYFCPEEGECELPAAYRDTFQDSENERPGVLTQEDLRRAADFAEAVGARITFCVNMGPGPRDPHTGRWTPENAEALIRFAKSLPNRDLFDVWEPGNEVNILNYEFVMPVLLVPAFFAGDLALFASLARREAPGALIAAPGCFFVPYEGLADLRYTRDLLAVSRENIDVVTWHLYATQSDRCPDLFSPARASKEMLFDESFIAMHRGFARSVAAAAAGKPVWLAETASAQCGGQAGVSDTLLDALWLADWIGIMAEEGSSLFVRQTIVGGDYGMLDPETFAPRPSFLAYVLFRRYVERCVLKTEGSRELLKAHGFCAAGRPGQVTAVLSNPNDEAVVAEIALVGTDVRRAEQWTLSASGNLYATRASIQGTEPAEDGTVPNPPGSPVHLEQGKAYVRVDPNALVFAVIEPAVPASACSP
jgi:heparanase 1